MKIPRIAKEMGADALPACAPRPQPALPELPWHRSARWRGEQGAGVPLLLLSLRGPEVGKQGA